MRIGRIEIRLRPRPRDWAVELWQWPHGDFVQCYRVKRVLIGVQVGPFEMSFWILHPGQYSLDRADPPRDGA